ncbi:hypothetical protein, partial [Paenibacillus polymyxa]
MAGGGEAGGREPQPPYTGGTAANRLMSGVWSQPSVVSLSGSGARPGRALSRIVVLTPPGSLTAFTRSHGRDIGRWSHNANLEGGLTDRLSPINGGHLQPSCLQTAVPNFVGSAGGTLRRGWDDRNHHHQQGRYR